MRNADRHRKIVQVTLSDAARACLDELAAETGDTRSAFLERLIIVTHTTGAHRRKRKGGK